MSQLFEWISSLFETPPAKMRIRHRHDDEPVELTPYEPVIAEQHFSGTWDTAIVRLDTGGEIRVYVRG